MNDVTLYLAESTDDARVLARARERLTDEERARADNFVFPEHRALFTVAHALLHHAIGDGPLEIVGNGRPELKDRRVRFNLSHTKGMAVVAVTAAADIGVDVEATQRRSDGVALADRFFAPGEVTAIQQDPTRFLRYWTLKESYIKAVGLGLQIPLQSFSFTLDPITIAGAERPWAFWQQQIGAHWVAICVENPLGRVDRVDVRL